MTGEAKRNYGFGDELDSANLDDWTPKTGANEETPPPSAEAVRQVSEEAGFTRDAQPAASKKEREGQITIRGKQSVMDEFRNFAVSQQPRWPLGYTLERALAALKREMEG